MNVYELLSDPEVHRAWQEYDKARQEADAACAVWRAAVRTAMNRDKETLP